MYAVDKTQRNTSQLRVSTNDEFHTKKSRATKRIVALAIASALCFLSAAHANEVYQEAGKAGSTTSWESPEYLKSHGLSVINASQAYAQGYTGKDVTIGVVDSGILTKHIELSGEKFQGATAQGSYYKNDTRYPFASLGLGGSFDDKTGEFKKGQAFETNGEWILGINDAHGTHVTAVVAGNRNGVGSHGVAFDANIVEGNTGGTDNMTYGAYQDYNYFKAVWEAVAQKGAKVINNSWGTNIRVDNDSSHHYNVGDIGSTFDYMSGQNGIEKEYYLFRQDAKKNGGKHFMDAAYEVAKAHRLVQIFTNGNRRFQNPYHRANLPFFNPSAEKYWIAAGGVEKCPDGSMIIYGDANRDDDTPFGGGGYNRAGVAKWWTVTSPTNVWGAYVTLDGQYDGDGNATEKSNGWKNAGGTSNAAPHIAGSMGVLMQRFPYMTATQIRDTLFTTASNQTWALNEKNQKVGEPKLLDQWDGPAGVPDNDYGWGIIDLGKAIYGPGQFLGDFMIHMDQDDTWSNDITDIALKTRQLEDEAEGELWLQRKSRLDDKIRSKKATQEEIWEYQYKLLRAQARTRRAQQGYQGRLIKSGKGSLTLLGTNSFTGGIKITEGTLVALPQSLGTGTVLVKENATLRLKSLATVEKAGPTGFVTQSLAAKDVNVNVTLEKGATLILKKADQTEDKITATETVMLVIKGGSMRITH